jgi:hypothetical protein
MFARLTICSLNALVLLLLHLFYFNANWSIPLEDEMMTLMNKTESFFLKQGRFKDSNFLFINTAYDKVLIRTEMEDGDSGNVVITDRSLLAKLFQKMADHGNEHRYLLCDVLFDTPCAGDAIFETQLSRVSKIILPASVHLDNADPKTEVKSLPLQKQAQAAFITFEGMVSKIRLYSQETHSKTLPLQMYEDCNREHSKANAIGLWCKKQYVPFAIYPRYFFGNEEIKKHEIRLSQVVKLLALNDSMFYHSTIKDRVIVIGDFSSVSDTHPTLIGQYMPGSIILFNTFLTLQAGYHLHSWRWFLFIIASFTLLTYYELFHKEQSITNRWTAVLAFLKLSGLCILVSIFSNLIFNIHTTILPMVVYFEGVSFFKKNIFPKSAL